MSKMSITSNKGLSIWDEKWWKASCSFLLAQHMCRKLTDSHVASFQELRWAYCTWPKPKIKDILWGTLCTFLHGGWSLCLFLCSFCLLFAQHCIEARKNSSNCVKVELRKVKSRILFPISTMTVSTCSEKSGIVLNSNYGCSNYPKWTCICIQKSIMVDLTQKAKIRVLKQVL